MPAKGHATDGRSLAREGAEQQDHFLTCCQTTGHHRFDCAEHPSGAPYLPIAPMTASQLVGRLRRESAA